LNPRENLISPFFIQRLLLVTHDSLEKMRKHLKLKFKIDRQSYFQTPPEQLRGVQTPLSLEELLQTPSNISEEFFQSF
jgi:hypothetical protein